MDEYESRGWYAGVELAGCTGGLMAKGAWLREELVVETCSLSSRVCSVMDVCALHLNEYSSDRQIQSYNPST